MRDSLLRVVLSEAGFKPLGVAFLATALTLVWGRRQVWSEFVWLPVFAISCWYSLPAVFGLLAGGYGVLATIMLWPFPVSAVILWFGRPKGRLFGGPAVVGSSITAGIVAVLWLLPRPNAILVQLRFLQHTGQPASNLVVHYFVYGGAGPNHNGTLRTDATGVGRFTVYYPEAGSIDIKKAPDGRSVHFQTNYRSYQFDGSDVVIDGVERMPTIRLRPQDMPNKALEPTPTSVTSPAAQEPRQP